MKRKWLVPLVMVAIVLAAGLGYTNFQNAHTFTLSNGENGSGAGIKTEQIQPVFHTVTVSVDTDTDVKFTDIETGRSYTIGYITNGMSEKIKLNQGKWYTVTGGGNITVKPINVRIVD